MLLVIVIQKKMVSPPKQGDESYEEFIKEEREIYQSLKSKSTMLVKGLNRIKGIECNPIEGAMYAFPRLVNLPDGALKKANEIKVSLDTLYALSLLEETGICVIPASGFYGNTSGRAGFRTTFLLPYNQMLKVVDEIARHHKIFCEKYEKYKGGDIKE